MPRFAIRRTRRFVDDGHGNRPDCFAEAINYRRRLALGIREFTAVHSGHMVRTVRGAKALEPGSTRHVPQEQLRPYVTYLG